MKAIENSHKNRLLVIWKEQIVGTLERHTRGRVVFQYDRHWLQSVGKPISLSLPCREEKYSPALSTAFFENLLPENQARTILAFNSRFDRKDTFAFLENFGEDCAGALSIISEKSNPDFTPGRYDCINNELERALDKIADDPKKYMLFPEMRTARLSIAGAQDKLPVYISDNRFYLPLTSGSPTTHIIKPASAGFPDIQKNEAFCMALAQNAGLQVPDSKLMTVGNHEVFVVDRYDRGKTAGRVLRIHQEDFCQALGLPSDRKYQAGGGPGFEECRQLSDEYLSDSGVEVKIDLSRIMIFNYLIGNHDAHGKNFSILHEPFLKLAPFYDLLSTQVYPLDNKFAMAIGQTFRHDRITELSFKKFSQDMKLRPKKLFSLMDSLVDKISNTYETLLGEHEKKYGPSKIYDDLFNVISRNIACLESICASSTP